MVACVKVPGAVCLRGQIASAARVDFARLLDLLASNCQPEAVEHLCFSTPLVQAVLVEVESAACPWRNRALASPSRAFGRAAFRDSCSGDSPISMERPLRCTVLGNSPSLEPAWFQLPRCELASYRLSNVPFQVQQEA